MRRLPFIRLARWSIPTLLVATGLIMLRVTWLKWPDVLIDFGGQLYIPWQLSAGKTLYQDLWYLKGPLSLYLNATWFHLFGTNLQTLVLCNAAIFAILVGLLYQILREISDRLSATLGCLTLLLLFGFGNLVGMGNYNFMCPYSHEVTHGIVLSALAIWFLTLYHKRRWWLAIAGSGLTTGLTFLTDPQVFLAGGVAVVLGLGLTLWADARARHQAPQLVVLFTASLFLPILLSYVLLSAVMPPSVVLNSLLDPWRSIVSGRVLSTPFYRSSLGLSDPMGNAWKLLEWTLRGLGLFIPLVLVALLIRGANAYRKILAGLVALIMALWIGRVNIAWFEAFRLLPVFLVASGIAWYVVFWGCRGKWEEAQPCVLRLTLVVWALLLLSKMVLNTRIYHYGFALAMPATLLLVVALVGWVPRTISRFGGYGAVFLVGSLVVWAACVSVHLQVMNGWLRGKTYLVGAGRDRFLADGRGIAANLLLEELNKRTQADDTLVVFPGQVMINYLSRRVNPTPYAAFWPLLFTIVGEDAVLTALQAHPPDFVALVHFDTSEDGPQFFGRDYAQRIYAWVREHYEEVVSIGAPPLQDHRFGMLLLKWKG